MNKTITIHPYDVTIRRIVIVITQILLFAPISCYGFHALNVRFSSSIHSTTLSFIDSHFEYRHHPTYCNYHRYSSSDSNHQFKSSLPSSFRIISCFNQSPKTSTSLSSNDTKNTSNENPSFYIRKAIYSDLQQVVDIHMYSFYKPSALVRPYLWLSILSNLQSNFPYDETSHKYYVACTTTTTNSNDNHMNQQQQPPKEIIIGFVDVDDRPSTEKNAPPRPYLSDLAVHKEYRNQGVAMTLIQKCETTVQSLFQKEELYLRVNKDNDVAKYMYNRLGYDVIPHDFFGVKDKTILLKRNLNTSNNFARRRSVSDDSEHNDILEVNNERCNSEDLRLVNEVNYQI